MKKSRRKRRQLPVSDFDLDLIMAARYVYYCKHRNILDDRSYDELESEYRLVHGNVLPVGSDKPQSYTDAQRALAVYFMLSGRMVQVDNPNTLL